MKNRSSLSWPWWLIILAICFWPITLIYLICRRRPKGQPSKPSHVIKAAPVTYADAIPGYALAYSYTNVTIFPPWEMLAPLDLRKVAAFPELDLEQESENAYDPWAVAIYWQDEQLGYMRKGRLQDMVNTWIQRGWPVFAHYEQGLKDGEDSKVTISMAFYRPEKK